MGERERVRPIYSTRADEPDLVDAIESFVVRVAETIDHLQDAEGGGDLAALARLASGFADAADRVGFGALAEVACMVAEAAHAEKDDDARARLEELTRLAHRVRLGHPGAF